MPRWTLSEILADIRYLTRKKNQFGAGSYATPQSNPRSDLALTGPEYDDVCGISIGTYYYLKKSDTKTTPFETHTIPSSSHEGEYHFNCKILNDLEYADYLIEEDTIKHIYSPPVKILADRTPVKPADIVTPILEIDQAGKINTFGKVIDTKLIICFVFCRYISLRGRINKYCERIFDDLTIDRVHYEAAQIKIIQLSDILKYFDKQLKELKCHRGIFGGIVGNINTFNEIMNLIKIDKVLPPNLQERIHELYNSLPTMLIPDKPKSVKRKSRTQRRIALDDITESFNSRFNLSDL
jgi:hypothetical protein